MGLADDLEQRLERVVEGFFSRAFRSKVQPAEIGRRLLREQEGGKSVSVDAVYVPNRYRVLLAPVDHERFEGLTSTLEQEFAALLKERAGERRWKFPGAVSIAFEADADLKEGRFHTMAEHDAEVQPEVDGAVAARLRIEGEDEGGWALAGQMVIGRESACDIVLLDGRVSRRHAQVEQREDGWWVIDLDSTNDTHVNGTIVKERRLQHGDHVTLGDTNLVFEQKD